MRYEDAFGSGNEIFSIGKLHLPTGTIAACDPFFCADAIPYTRSVPPGSYVVQLRIAQPEGWGARVALARILFKAEAETVAIKQASSPAPWPSSFFVDSGLASFMDETARAAFANVLAKFYLAHPKGNYFTDVLLSELRDQAVASGFPGGSGRSCIHNLPRPGLNVAIFASGLGDGAYESFWGLDKH